MTGIKCRINPKGWFRVFEDYTYNICLIQVPHQELDANSKSYKTTNCIAENAIKNTENIDILFYRMMVEKINSKRLQQKVWADKKFALALKGVYKFYWTNWTEVEKKELLKMSSTERYNFFIEFGKDSLHKGKKLQGGEL